MTKQQVCTSSVPCALRKGSGELSCIWSQLGFATFLHKILFLLRRMTSKLAIQAQAFWRQFIGNKQSAPVAVRESYGQWSLPMEKNVSFQGENQSVECDCCLSLTEAAAEMSGETNAVTFLILNDDVLNSWKLCILVSQYLPVGRWVMLQVHGCEEVFCLTYKMDLFRRIEDIISRIWWQAPQCPMGGLGGFLFFKTFVFVIKMFLYLQGRVTERGEKQIYLQTAIIARAMPG